jgi:hypothetical protein
VRVANLRRAAQDPRLAALAAGLVLVVVAVGFSPIILREGTQDWIAYEQAAQRLETGAPLYDFELESDDQEYFLYPPMMAAAWALVGSPGLLLVVKLVALLGIGGLASLVFPPDRRRIALGGALVLAAIGWPPTLHDLVLGNVMALYAGAIPIAFIARGWRAALPLGLVLALAAKPTVGPLLLWLLLRRTDVGLRVLVVAASASAVTAVAIGIPRYVEYLAALPSMTVLARPFTGNLGLVAISPEASLVGLVVAYVAAVVAATRFGERPGFVVAVGAMLLAQGTLGLNYAAVLLPSLVVLWIADRTAGLLTWIGAAVLLFVGPVPAAVATMTGGLAAGLRHPRGAEP